MFCRVKQNPAVIPGREPGNPLKPHAKGAVKNMRRNILYAVTAWHGSSDPQSPGATAPGS
jgi:hypothetical protein